MSPRFFLLKTIAIIDSPAGVLASPLYTATLLHTYSKSIVMLHVYACTHVCVCVCVCVCVELRNCEVPLIILIFDTMM